MKKILNSHIDVRALCRRSAEIEGTYPLNPIAKATHKLLANGNSVHINLNLFQNSEGLKIVDIKWNTIAQVSCERCLDPMELELFAQNQLAVCQNNDEASKLPEEYEPLVIADGEMMSIEHLLAEEILLALPLIPRHKSACLTVIQDAPSVPDEDVHQPFAHLDQNLLQ